MENEKAKKKTSIVVPILWAVITIIWIITACINISAGTLPPFAIGLNWAAALVSAVTAVVHYLKYKRSRDDKSE